jgi:hypothetical protein
MPSLFIKICLMWLRSLRRENASIDRTNCGFDLGGKSCKFRGVKTFRKIFTFIISFPLIYDIL